MRVTILLIIALSAVSSLENPKLVDSRHGHQFTTHSYYEEILEELNGAHLRFAASHVSLYYEKKKLHLKSINNKKRFKRIIYAVPQCHDNRNEPW